MDDFDERMIEAGPEDAAEPDPVAMLGPQIRDLRKARRLTLTDLSRRTGLSIGHLSQVERGLSTPTIRQLQQISAAMGVQIGWFFRSENSGESDESAVVVRADRRRTIGIGELGIIDELLVPDLEGKLELLLCTIEPGCGSGDDPYTHDGEEAGLMLAGQLDLWVDDRCYHLETGDSFAFASTRPHRYRNPGPSAARIVWVITPPSF